jgi:hypothetical protein
VSQMPTGNPDVPQTNLMLMSGELQRRIRASASNFYWIAGLSIANTIAYFMGKNLSFVVGLAVTQVIDILAINLAHTLPNSAMMMRGLGLFLDLFICGVFVLFGFFARKGLRWAFIAGLILYGLDTILVAVAIDWIGFGFHAFFFWLLFSGFLSLDKLIKLAANNTVDSIFPRKTGS